MKPVLTLILIVFMVQGVLALPNPAAVYCERLGYEYRIVETPQGQKGMVIVEPGVEFDAWDFFKGKVGSKYSYGALYGYDTQCVREDKGAYVVEYAVCIPRKGVKKGERIPLLDLMEQNGDPLIKPVWRKSFKPSNALDHADDKEQEIGAGIIPRGAGKALPSEFDWRSKDGRSYIGPIHDQGGCGSCYAFAAAAAAEGVYNWATGKYDGNCADFSESFIIWCLGRLPAYSSHFFGCGGADWDYAELTAISTEGICNESDFPYTESDPGSCTHWDDPVTVFSSWGRVDCSDVDAIKTAIMTYGIVDAAVLAGGAFYPGYTDGVYEDSNTDCPPDPGIGPECYHTYSNHAIALVGWDDNPAEGGGGCWILRNSWGASWGESGYMRIRYTSARVACEVCYMIYETNNTHTLTVTSEYGGADPAVGVHAIVHGTEVTCQITNSPVESGTTQYVCVGWTGTGSVPATGSDTNAGTFTLTNDSTIIWLWGTNVLSAPTPPTLVSASDGTYTGKVQVTWSVVTNATSYEVWRNTSNSTGSASCLAETNDTSCDDTNVLAGISYYYWIKGKNSLATSDFSNGDSGYASSGESSGSADLALSNFILLPAALAAGEHPGVLAFLLINYGPDSLALPNTRVQYNFYLSQNATFGDSDDVWMGDCGADQTLSAGADTTVMLSETDREGVTIPEGMSGNYYVFVRVRHASPSTLSDPDESNNYAPRSGTIAITSSGTGPGYHMINDFDGDGKTDIAVYHEASGYWFIILSSSGTLSYQKLGETGYNPVPGDFDGDGKADLTVFHEASGYWYYILSSSGSLGYAKLGETGYAPVPADFDGDGKADLAVYNGTTGWWYYILSSSGSLGYAKLGETGYAPVPADYEGDGKADLTVYNETTGWWYYILSSSGSLGYTKLGESGYAPVPADYDGDGKADLAVYNETTGWWYYILSSSGSLGYTKLGESGYDPVLGDYDGDGKFDLAVYHEVSGYWYIILSSSCALSYQKLGEPGYRPIE